MWAFGCVIYEMAAGNATHCRAITPGQNILQAGGLSKRQIKARLLFACFILVMLKYFDG
jgi:hypothetical protein